MVSSARRLGVACAATVYGVVTLLCVLCYSNSLDGEFVHDDIAAIVRNPDVCGRSPLSALLRDDFWGKPMSDPSSHKSYRPITTLSFRLTSWLSGQNPRAFHVVNVVLHTVVSLQFAFLCRRHLAWEWESVLTASALFATHPVHTEAVSSIVGQAEVLSAIFFLSGLVTFLNESSPPIQRLLLTSCCSYLALLAKEQGITLLFVCAVTYVIIDQRYEKKKRKGSFLANRQLLVLISALALGMGCRILLLQGDIPRFSEQDNPASHHPVLLTRVLTYFHLPVANLWLLLCPLTLSYDWQLGSVPLVTSLRDLRNLYSLVVYCFLAAFLRRTLTLRKRQNRKGVVLGLTLLVLPFLPASNLLLPVGFVVAERVLYIPSLGFCILVVEGIQRHSYPFFQWVVRTAAVAAVLFFCLRTVRRNQDWLSRETLFRSGLESVPHNAKVHYNFANLQKDKGNNDLAIAHYQRAIRLWPNYASAHNNLGTLLSSPAEAERHFRSALWISPDHARAHYNLAALYRSQGNTELAVWLLNRAVTFDPGLEDAFSLLAAIYTDAEVRRSNATHIPQKSSRPRHAVANQTKERARATKTLHHVTFDHET